MTATIAEQRAAVETARHAIKANAKRIALSDREIERTVAALIDAEETLLAIEKEQGDCRGIVVR